MTTAALVRLGLELGRELPASDVLRLAAAVRQGRGALQEMLGDVAGIAVRTACRKLLAAELPAEDRHLIAGALLAATEPDPGRSVVDAVWTGPDTGTSTSRLTSAVVVDLIGEARTDVLLVGYAVHTEPSIARALHDAQARGATITLLLERSIDNLTFTGSGGAFGGLPATRLAWPAAHRPSGASLHAKVLVVDGAAALIGSANLTGAALERNLECGLLVRGGSEPAAVRAHIGRLLEAGELVHVT